MAIAGPLLVGRNLIALRFGDVPVPGNIGPLADALHI